MLTLTELAQAIDSGCREFQYYDPDKEEWFDFSGPFVAPSILGNYFINPKHWRIKSPPEPELKTVDLSVLVDSGIDCEFWHDAPSVGGYIGQLGSIGVHEYQLNQVMSGGRKCYPFCRPRLDHWQSLMNKPIPSIKFKRILSDAGFEFKLDGRHILFTGLADGYCYPWEVSAPVLSSWKSCRKCGGFSSTVESPININTPKCADCGTPWELK